jgi:hypothetical protein
VLALTLSELKPWYPDWFNTLKDWIMRESQTLLKFRQMGVVEASQQILKRLLTKKFGSLSQSLAERIDATTDTDRLNAGIDQIDQLARADDLNL